MSEQTGARAAVDAEPMSDAGRPAPAAGAPADGHGPTADAGPVDGQGPTDGTGSAGVDSAPGAQRGGGARRGLGAAVVGCVVGAALTLITAGATWIHVRIGVGAGAAPLPLSLSGGTLAPAATALGLVGLAGAVAFLAARRTGRVLAGLAVLAAGVAIAVVAAKVALDPAAAARSASKVRELAAGGPAQLSGLRHGAWPWLSFAGGVVLATTGALVVLRGRRWPALGGRYETPAARPVSAWDALERGEDPT